MAEDKFFFSYSRFDSEFVLRLTKDLREAGANVWLDQLDIAPGSRWDKEIERALNDASCMLAILSQKSIDSVNVMDEISYALEENKKVIPILLNKIEPPFRLRRLQHIDFTTSYDKGFLQLINALNLKKNTIAPGTDEEAILWEEAYGINTISAYKKYLRETKTGDHKREAGIKIEELQNEAEKATKEKERIENENREKLKAKETRKIEEKQRPVQDIDKSITGKMGKIILIVGICLVVLLFGLKGILKEENNIDNTEVDNTETTEQRAWEATLNENTPDAFKNYQKNYPGGKHFNEAQIKIDQLEVVTKPEPVAGNNSSSLPGLYPQASERLLTGNDMQGLSNWDIKIMRNEIFARHNFIFKTDGMRAYFEKQPWYQGLYDDVNNQLSDIEKINITFIKTYEK
jgi:hypothetical protein